MSPRLSLLLALGAAAIGVLLHREQQRGTFETFDRKHREFLSANPGQAEWNSMAEKPQIVLARLDDPDLPLAQRAFEAWPPRADEWQVVLQNLTAWQPRAVACAVPPTVENPSPGFLTTLAAVPGLTGALEAVAALNPNFTPPTLPERLPVLQVEGASAGIPEFDSLRPPPLPISLGIGDVDLSGKGQKISIEGEWCLVPLLARTGTAVVPTLALRSLLAWSGIPPEKLTVQPGTAILGPKGTVIPIDDSGCFRFYAPLAERTASVQADEFLFTRAQAETTYPPGSVERAALEAVRGSLIWLGTDDQAARTLKLPDGNTASPADLITRALAAIQTGRFLRPLPPWWQAAPQGVAILFGLWLVRWKRRNVWKGVAIGALALLTASLLAFQTNHTWIPLAPALLQLAFAGITGLLLPKAGT